MPPDNWKPSKKKSPERIDGIVALIMGLASATTHGDDGYFDPKFVFLSMGTTLLAIFIGSSLERIDGIVGPIMGLASATTADDGGYWKPEDGLFL